ncbi:MAG: cytochrome c oxidase subunit II [Planctomycetes bacterium]|nr:cytochrome c oxidase subunit II [Planctomycetota bacterium]
MWKDLPLHPEQASTLAQPVDLLYLFLVAVSAFFALLISVLIVVFTAKYRKDRPNATSAHIEGSTLLEIVWTGIPLGLTMIMFGWGAVLFFQQARPPANALEFTVTGKQWMWKAQHPTGQREINDLHIPIGVPCRLTMTSEDVIHSYFIPAFRTKQDVVPGRYSQMWFEANKLGTYDLFCAEYCGTKHSQMIGKVTVLSQKDYEVWLAGGGSSETPAQAGERLFSALRCITCHNNTAGARGPDLAGKFGTEALLTSGAKVMIDAEYVRESILNPAAKTVNGFQVGLMPTYQGQVKEDDILALIAYLKTFGAAKAAASPATGNAAK